MQATYVVDALRNTPVRGSTHAFAEAGKTLVFTLAAKPTHGAVKLEEAGKDVWSYTPAGEFTGYDEFRITASAGSDKRTPRVMILVNAPRPRLGARPWRGFCAAAIGAGCGEATA